MDGRKNNGGARKGAGRKPRSEEIKLIEQLDKHINRDEVTLKLKELILKGDFKAIQLYMNYIYGKPKDNVDITTNGEMVSVPIIHFKKSE
jgi:hypothetical protein